ncbi:hypothetical protein ACFVGN_02260 [Streptomyces sp. NPDC057757]|uniref:hypothetical protein n=1 Tax=Streptomyces sp. NPDC057757 TaxID=3346241 RepID=UPI0036750804
MDDDAAVDATMPTGSFREDVQKLIKLCGLTQKAIAENHLHVSATRMSGKINSNSPEWQFFKQVIEVCLEKIASSGPAVVMPQDWDTLDYWHNRFDQERESSHLTAPSATPETSPGAAQFERTDQRVRASPLRRAVIAATAVVGVAGVAIGGMLFWGNQEESRGASEGSSSPASSSASTKAAGDPWLEVTGTCVGPDKQWQVKSSGFTPHGTYTVNATYPNGRPYPLDGAGDRGTQGVANGDGSLKTRWQCYAPDPEGTYTMTVRDEATGKSATAKFYVDKPN